MKGHLMHSRHRSRVENIERLIATLREREILRDEMGDVLGMGTSGVRKYLRDLIGAGVIVLDRYIDPTRFTLGTPVYQITSDTAKVDAYLKAIRAECSIPRRPGAKSYLSIAMSDPTRHIHVASDDDWHRPRVERKKPAQRDPLALPVDFFVPAKGFCERRTQERITAPVPSGFAAFAEIKLNIGSAK
jgi:hypothetical protein